MMMKPWLRIFIFVLSIALIGLSVVAVDDDEEKPALRRRLLSIDPRSVAKKEKPKKATFTLNFDAFLKESYIPDSPTRSFNVAHNEWCSPPQLPPLDYADCNVNGVINAVPLHPNPTGAFKFLLLSAIKAAEDDGSCFFVDETSSSFPRQFGPFLQNCFEPIGLPANSELVRAAADQQRVTILPWEHVWNDIDKRRVEKSFNTILKLNYLRVEGHELKRNMLRRLWRPLPSVRDMTCSRLQDHLHGDEYIALSIPAQALHGPEVPPLSEYIRKIERVLPIHFQSRVPLFPIFVATDDCSRLEELRKLRPKWRFVSECDKPSLLPSSPGSKEEMDEKNSRLLLELFAQAGAKVWIGVADSDISWWVYFMRQKEEAEHKTFILLETKGSEFAPMMW